MVTRNSRRTRASIEPYDPKQRLVGGIVLFLLMMLLYYLLKAVLGISSSGVDYALSQALPNEINRPQLGQIILNAGNDNFDDTMNPEVRERYKNITQFEFLGLNGEPLDHKTKQQTTSLNKWDLDGSFKWEVQAASFKDKERAEVFMRQLKRIRLKSRMIKSGRYYIIRLEPQKTRNEAKQQVQLLRSKLRVRGIIKER